MKGIGRNIRCKLLQKRSTGKTRKYIISKVSEIILSLKYIKLVIQKILFILVLWNFNFYFKLYDPPTPK